MSMFYGDQVQPSTPLATGRPTGFWDRFGASFTQESIRTDAWMRRTEVKQGILSDVSQKAFGDENLWRSMPDWEFLQRVNKLSQARPDEFRGLPKSVDEINGMVNEKLLSQYDEAADVLARAPDDAFAAETLGALGRAATDEIGVASAFAGMGIGTAARVGFMGNIAIEAALGAAGSAAILPTEYAVAKQLGLPDPNAVEEILMGAAGGAIGGAVIEGTARAIVAATRLRGVLDRMRQSQAELHTTGGVKSIDHQQAERQASKAVTEGRPEDLPEKPSVDAFRPSRGPDGLGPNEFRNLSDAVIWQESRGNPAAVGPVITAGSNKGDQAIGLMQVMPNTAMNPGPIPNVFEVARNMGVRVNGETKAEAIRLLQNPRVNRAFGESYLQAKIRKYNGDTEAALIAYNAGDKYAQRFIDNGRDWSVLPQREQTEPYVKNILGRVIGPEDGGLGFNGAPRRFRVADLETDPGVYQFKPNKGGRTGSLKGETYDEAAAGALVVHERLDGRRVVADGHERFGLASDAGPETPVNAIVLREADGWTEDAVLARTGIMDYLQGQIAAEDAGRVLRARAVDAEARARNPGLYARVDELQAKVKALESSFDPGRLQRSIDRVGKATTKKGTAKAEGQVAKQEQAVQDLNAARSDLAAATAERNRLLEDVNRTLPQTKNEARDRYAVQAAAAENATGPTIAGLFAAAPRRGVRATVKDVAQHVRGRVPESPAGRGSPDPVERVHEVSPLAEPEGVAAYSDPSGPAASDAGGEAFREIEQAVADPEISSMGIEFDEKGNVTGTAGQLAREVQEDAEFLADLEVCPTGKV